MGLGDIVKGAVGGFIGSGGNPLGAVLGGIGGAVGGSDRGAISGAAGAGAAAADPFASERGYYQGLLRNIYGGGTTTAPATAPATVAGGGGLFGGALRTTTKAIKGITQPKATTEIAQPFDSSAYFRQLPGYQFAFDEAMRSVTRSAAAKGLLKSGNLLFGLQQRAAGLAEQTYGGEMERLMALSGATVGSPGAAGQIAYQGGMERAKYGIAQKEQITRGIGGLLDYVGGGRGITGATPEYLPAQSESAWSDTWTTPWD